MRCSIKIISICQVPYISEKSLVIPNLFCIIFTKFWACSEFITMFYFSIYEVSEFCEIVIFIKSLCYHRGYKISIFFHISLLSTIIWLISFDSIYECLRNSSSSIKSSCSCILYSKSSHSKQSSSSKHKTSFPSIYFLFSWWELVHIKTLTKIL